MPAANPAHRASIRSWPLPVPRGFRLDHAVTRYGFYLLAPNQWDARRLELKRPLRLQGQNGAPVTVSIRPSRRGDLAIRIGSSRALGPVQRRRVDRQIIRMLRLDEDFQPWFARHEDASKVGFARLFRSPTLFEDIIKTQTSCNMAWSGTIRMNQRLCSLHPDGAFPSPRELLELGEAGLRQRCGVGYRARWMIGLAEAVVSGTLDLDQLESHRFDTAKLERKLARLPGVGPYARANLLMLLGRYDRLAFDTEMVRVAREHLGIDVSRTPAGLKRLRARLERHYAPYGPWAFLAYWYDLWFGSRYDDQPPT
ncbi:MAG: hypothetical protein JJU36_00070 [Phycisphaeraceae bacterium]|nr:hypothetical protein [Phycisphaeraceae bacterium]